MRTGSELLCGSSRKCRVIRDKIKAYPKEYWQERIEKKEKDPDGWEEKERLLQAQVEESMEQWEYILERMPP